MVGQALTAVLGFIYLAYHKIPVWGIETKGIGKELKEILKIGIAPFGIAIRAYPQSCVNFKKPV